MSTTEQPLYSAKAGEGSTAAAEAFLKIPQKRFFRQRAHANVFIDHALDYPASPDQMDWAKHYPAYFPPSNGETSSTPMNALAGQKQAAEWADVGCGFGGLLMDLAPKFPDTLMLGMEIRPSVTAYVSSRILASRQIQSSLPADSPDVKAGGYQNVSVIRANSMKHMPNFFAKAQLSKIFFLFPDPHFKLRKQKARIVTTSLIAEYAYILKPGGIIYTVTDVKDLHDWMAMHLDRHPLFDRIPDAEMADDAILQSARMSTEEGKKVERNAGSKWAACYRRKEDPEE